MAAYARSTAGGGSGGTGNRSVTVTTAVSGSLLVAFVSESANLNTTQTMSDDHADGLGAWTRIGTALWGSSLNNSAVFVRNSLLGSTDTSFVVTCESGSNTAGEIVVVEITGMSLAGSSAIRSSGSQADQASGTTPAPALNQSALTGNVTLAAVMSGDTTTSEASGWTERQDVSQANPTTALEVCTRDSGFTGTTITFGATCATTFAAWAIELDGSSPQAVTGATIASGVALNAPTVAPGPVEVAGATIASASATNAPSAAYEIAAAFLASTLSLFAPTVAPGAVEIAGAHIASGATLNAPSVSLFVPGRQWILPGYGQVQELGVRQAILPGYGQFQENQEVPAGGLNITLAHISSGAVLNAPTITVGAVEVSGATIASGAVLNAPSAAYAVAAEHVASTVVLNAPTVAPGSVEVGGAHIGSGVALNAPTVSPGSVEVAGAHVASTAALNVPSLAYQVDLPTIASGSTLFAPTVTPGAVTIDGATIASGIALFAPTVAQEGGTQEVAGAHIASTAALTAPTLAYEVQGGTIASGSATFAPSAAYELNGATIAAGSVLFAPTVIPDQAVAGAHIASTVALNAPTVTSEGDIAGAHIASTAVLTAPTVNPGPVAVTAAHVASTAVLNAPTLAAEVNGAHIGSTAALNAPMVAPGAVTVLGVHLASTAVVNSPTLAYAVTGATIASTAVTNAPTLAYEVAAPTIASTASLFEPTVSTGSVEVTGAHIYSSALLFEPSVFVGQLAEFVRFVFDRTGRPAVSRLNAVELNGSGVPDFVLTHEWTMDEAAGTDRVDLVGGYPLLEQGDPLDSQPGQLGNAVVCRIDLGHLEGASGEELEAHGVSLLPTAGPFTLSFWFNPGGTNGSTQVMLHIGRGTTLGTVRLFVSLPDGRDVVTTGIFSSSSGVGVGIVHTITIGQWYLYALRRTSNDLWSIALWDGTAWTDVAHPTPIILAPIVSPLAVGAYIDGTFPANVTVDSLKLWAGIVSNADVLALQSGGQAGPPSALALFTFAEQGQPAVSRLTDVALFTTGQEE